MNIILFGSTGFLGKSVHNALLASSHKVIVIKENITDYVALSKIKHNADLIINCAAKVPPSTYEQYIEVNFEGTKNIIKWAKQNNIPKIIHCSTMSVLKKEWINALETDEYFVENPYSAAHYQNLNKNIDYYCYSKLQAEREFKYDFPNSIILRFSALYGNDMKWQGIIANCVDSIINNTEMYINTNGYGDFLHISDATNIVLSCINKNITGIINAASGVETHLPYLVNHDKVNYFQGPNSRAQINIDKMKNELGYTPKISIEEGMLELIEKRLHLYTSFRN